jgi:hypothetical protein
MNRNRTVIILIMITFIEIAFYLGYIFFSPVDILNRKPIEIILFNNKNLGPYFVMLLVLCAYFFLSLLYIHKYWISALILEGLFFIVEFYKTHIVIALHGLSNFRLESITLGVSMINALLLLIALTSLYKFMRLNR